MLRKAESIKDKVRNYGLLLDQGKPCDFRDYDKILKDLNINYYKMFGKPESQIPWISESQANKVLAFENAVPQHPNSTV